jgi:hypothetical protein
MVDNLTVAQFEEVIERTAGSTQLTISSSDKEFECLIQQSLENKHVA